MSEIADKIQTPAVSECRAETPAQPLEPPTPEPDQPAQDESALTAQISELWRLHTDYKGSIKNQTENLRSLRSELGKLLHQMKGLLARPGRNGQWSAWLKERKISRATADRLVLRHERSLHPDSNCLTDSITEPTEAEIQTLLDKVLPKLRKLLRTKTSVYRFIELLVSSLTLDHQATEEAILILRPAQQTAVAEPVEASAEPVAVIADAQVEGDPESTATSVAL